MVKFLRATLDQIVGYRVAPATTDDCTATDVLKDIIADLHTPGTVNYRNSNANVTVTDHIVACDHAT